MKSNKQRPIYKLCHIQRPNLYQPWTIVAKSFMSQQAGLIRQVLKRNSVHRYLASVFARVLKSCKKLSTYRIYNRCLCKFTNNLAISFKITCQKFSFCKVSGSSMQVFEKLNSFRGTSLEKNELGQFNHKFTQTACLQRRNKFLKKLSESYSWLVW